MDLFSYHSSINISCLQAAFKQKSNKTTLIINLKKTKTQVSKTMNKNRINY